MPIVNSAQNRLRITLIVENNTPSGLVEEHGFAVWVEAGDRRIVFDTGQGAAFERNAQRLGIDLAAADALVLSHGHYDHTGGVSAFLAANHHAPVISSSNTQGRRYSCPADQAPRMIGISGANCSVLDALPATRRLEIDGPRYLAPGIGITGPVPHKTPFEDSGGPFFLDETRTRPDPIADDLSMWFETGDGLLVLTGCCHSGIANTVDYISATTGIDRVYGIVGGLHLLHASEDRLINTLRFLDDCAPRLLIPCHCTGATVVDRIVARFGQARTIVGKAGQSYDLGVLR